MSSLYNLTDDYQRVENMLYDDAYDEQTVLDTLEAISDAIEDKADSYAKIISGMDANIEALKNEEMRLKSRRMALEGRKEWLKGNLFTAMKNTGKIKFKTALYSFGIQKNGGKRKLVLDVEPDKLPHTLRTIQYVPNNEAIRDFLGDEESCAFAHLEEQGESLRIR